MKPTRHAQSQQGNRGLLSRWMLGLGVILGAVWIYVDLAEDVLSQEILTWDRSIIIFIHHLSNPSLDKMMVVITQFGEAGAILAAIGASIYFARHKMRVDSLTILFSLGGGVVINTLLKILFLRPRPTLFVPLVAETGFSFPSGHVTAAGSVFGMLAVLLWRKGNRLWAGLFIVLIFAVAVSRIYLGVHYPSDTISAIIFCFLWLTILFFVRDRCLVQSQNRASKS